MSNVGSGNCSRERQDECCGQCMVSGKGSDLQIKGMTKK